MEQVDPCTGDCTGSLVYTPFLWETDLNEEVRASFALISWLGCLQPNFQGTESWLVVTRFVAWLDFQIHPASQLSSTALSTYFLIHWSRASYIDLPMSQDFILDQDVCEALHGTKQCSRVCIKEEWTNSDWHFCRGLW